MPSLPPAIVPLLSPFASLFDARTWRKAQILLTGVILAPGRRTVSTALYVLGLQARGDFALFHHVLSRASWSSLAVSRVLWEQLVRQLVPTGPIRLAIDETLERRWGEKIEALGVYLDRYMCMAPDVGDRWRIRLPCVRGPGVAWRRCGCVGRGAAGSVAGVA